MPRMMVTACSLGEARFRRVPRKERAERCFHSLREFYRAEIRPKIISKGIEQRLHAISVFAIENRILTIRRQPRLFLRSSNNLRISIPPCFTARVNGKFAFIVFSYNDDFPLHDGVHLTAAGKAAVGGLSLMFEKDKVRGPSSEIFDLPSQTDEILVVDVSKARWMKGVRTIRIRAEDLFLAPYRSNFLAKQAAAELLYSEACKKLGIDDGGSDDPGDVTDKSDLMASAKPKKRSA